MEAGWLAEVNQLIDQNTDFSKVQSIGYKELYSVIKQETSIKEALEVIQQKTRRYAKRQITWFKNQLPSIDVEVDLAHPEMTLQKMKHIIEEFLNT